ncbi:hypothetical protein E3220_05055 [Piscirickettsia salmonis EM-90]|nr:hypothetical protein E3220_05055 [Piscirickettsia salmonis EM-90]
MLEFLSHNCKEKASFFLIVFFNLLIVCQKLLIERYTIFFSGGHTTLVVSILITASLVLTHSNIS